MVVTNSKHGSSGGYAWSESGGRITKLTVWEKKWLDKGTKWGVTVVQLTIDGTEKDVHGNSKTGPESTNTAEISFASDEKVTSMSIWAGTWVHRIHIVTDKQTFNSGGDGGTEYKQSLGSGKLVGFQGNSGQRLDSIGSIFKSLS